MVVVSPEEVEEAVAAAAGKPSPGFPIIPGYPVTPEIPANLVTPVSPA